MSMYRQLFRKTLVSEADTINPAASDVGAAPAEPSDSDVWAKNNQNIVNNPGLSKSLNVEPIPPEVEQEFRSKIQNWVSQIDQLEKMFKDDMLKFATEKGKQGGPVEAIYNKTINAVQNSLETLGKLKGTLAYLPDIVTVAMARDDHKKRGVK